MEKETEQVYRYILRTVGLEELLAETLTAARSKHQYLPDVVRDYILHDMHHASGVNQQDLEAIVDWETIARKLEYRQSLNEMAYL